MRKMATIRKINDIRPIDGADSIECAVVDGWNVVIKKGEFHVGDVAVYCEIDSWIPHALAPFLSKGQEPREFEGVKGERLRTVKLRGQVSQGLLLPMKHLTNYGADLYIGYDVSEMLNIKKWEAPIPAQLAGEVRGVFPGFIPKTTQERCMSGDTLIETSLGPLKIEEIVRKKLDVNVASFNHETSSIEMKRITDWSIMNRRDCWVKLTLKSGREIICTNNHKIWCDDISAYRRADCIQIGQKVITKTEH